jgi:hypothetical protein
MLLNIQSVPTKNILMQFSTLPSVRLEHKRRVYENLLNQRISAGISLNEQIIRDQEEEEDDKSPTQSCK